MPNWCTTTYKCVGDKKEVKQLYTILQNLQKRKRPLYPKGWSGNNMWLGCLLIKMGFDWQEHRCRGEITDFSLSSDTVLTISQETAWCEQEGVRECIEKKYPSIKVYYEEIESGCDLFHTNDVDGDYFKDRYFLDSYEDWDYFKSLEDAAKHVSKIVGHEVEPDFNAIEKALDDYVEAQDDDDVFYCFHEIIASED